MTIDNILYIYSNLQSRKTATGFFSSRNKFQLDLAKDFYAATRKIYSKQYNLLITDDFDGECFNFWYFSTSRFPNLAVYIFSDNRRIKQRANELKIKCYPKTSFEKSLATIVNSYLAAKRRQAK